MKLIAITGGIGCGKSIILTILKTMGYHVYDCDSNAKKLMDNSSQIKNQIALSISPNVIDNGIINRGKLAEIVFNDSLKLKLLNNFVHTAVKNDILKWKIKNQDSSILFIETAILYQSGLDKLVDEVWDIYASEAIRVERVMLRNNLTKEQVYARINSQQYIPEKEHSNIKRIINEKNIPIIPQILSLI